MSAPSSGRFLSSPPFERAKFVVMARAATDRATLVDPSSASRCLAGKANPLKSSQPAASNRPDTTALELRPRLLIGRLQSGKVFDPGIAMAAHLITALE
jgi:hypothetical protein